MHETKKFHKHLSIKPAKYENYGKKQFACRRDVGNIVFWSKPTLISKPVKTALYGHFLFISHIYETFFTVLQNLQNKHLNRCKNTNSKSYV